MKIGFWIISTAVGIGLITLSCRKEKSMEINFEYRIEGEAPYARVYLENLSRNFQDCLWEVSEGADWHQYEGAEAPILHVDKSGTLTITLILRNLNEENRITKTLSISGHDAIVHHQNICLAYNHLAREQGRCFTSRLGKLYSDSEISVHTSAEIDLIFDGEMATAYNLFVSPDHANTINLSIPEAHATRFTLDHGLSDLDFDTIADARGMRVLDNCDSPFAMVDITNLPNVIGFEHIDGRRGYILCSERSLNGFIVDIKVEKYPSSTPLWTATIRK